jgi:8-oxo-dGTP diphosphatase
VSARGMRRSIAGVCAKGDTYFVAKRIPGGALGGKWEFPGGKVEAGETCEEALAREFFEEFRVPIRVGTLICEVEFAHDGVNFTLSAYQVALGSETFVLSEHTQTAWRSLAEIGALDFAESDKKILPFLNGAAKST